MSNKVLHIIIDHREHKLKALFDQKKDIIQYESKQLDIADVIVSNDVAIERKEGFDFVSSIMDNRLFEQLLRLKETYANPILILEGENLLTKRNINHNAIFGSLASISVDFGIPVLTTKDALETADLLKVIAQREQREDKKAVAVRGEKTQMSIRERQQFIIEGLPNVSAVIAKRLLNHFGSVKDIANATEKELLEVKGIGKNIASDIIKLLNANYLESPSLE